MQNVQRVIVLGSTGSIGTATLDVIRDFRERFDVVGLAAHSNTDLLARQIAEFSPRAVCVTDLGSVERGTGVLDAALKDGELLLGEAGLEELVRRFDADLLVVATVGFVGLAPTLAGIERGMRIALANKEVLVVAGEMVMSLAREAGVDILPIDSEHNAVFQCLAGNEYKEIRRIVLTASGGPFRTLSREEIDVATPAQALAHPTWEMGRKISVDSASFMNKGFEVIEACHLFGVGPEKVDVVVHPQSVLHSMVEFVDNSIIAQMGPTNMYLPILNVLTYPERLGNKFEPLDLVALGKLDFYAPDTDRFPCLSYAYEAISVGGALPAVMNGANEVAVAFFLDGKISFGGIASMVRAVMDRYIAEQSNASDAASDLKSLRRADALAREMAIQYAGNIT